MMTSSPALPWVGCASTGLKQPPLSPARNQMLHFQRLVSVTSAPSASLLSALLPPPSPSAAVAASSLVSLRVQSFFQHPLPGQNYIRTQSRRSRSSELISGKLQAVSSGSRSSPVTESEEVFFDGGVHYGDLLVNLVFGLTLVWLPLTLTAVFRNLFLRYRFTNLRVTVQSGVLGGDRKDFSYDVVKGVKAVPRFIGEWGDMAIELKDGTNVDIRCVPKFREIAKYVEQRAERVPKSGIGSSSPAKEGTRKKGFS